MVHGDPRRDNSKYKTMQDDVTFRAHPLVEVGPLADTLAVRVVGWEGLCYK